MNTTIEKSNLIVAKKRGSYRRLLLLTVVLLLVSVIGWKCWGVLQDWADAKALRNYFSELEVREPGWQDRVYGKPLTQAQLDDERKWDELQGIYEAYSNVLAVIMRGLSEGMRQNPSQPAAMLPEEQIEFMNAAHQCWLPVLQKLSTMEKLPGHHRFADRKASYETIQAQLALGLGFVPFQVRCGIELEVMYQIMMNEPEQALKWFMKCSSPDYTHLYAAPFLIERWLNLSQPEPDTLLQMQHLLEQQIQETESIGFLKLGAELRRREKIIRELPQGAMTSAQIERLSSQYRLIDKNSNWNSSYLDWLRPLYLKYRVATSFQRSNHLILRLHQLADRVEELSRLDPSHRWSSWKNFADDNSINENARTFNEFTKPASYSDAIPEGLYVLHIKFLHSNIVNRFEEQAQLKTALAAVINERYRREHGKFSANWANLVPQYVAKPILDPYSGDPLHIRMKENSVVIYSVGRDGKDEGGEHLSHNHYWNYGGKDWDLKNTNLGTRVYLPALRRGPAIQLEDKNKEALKESAREALRLMKEK